MRRYAENQYGITTSPLHGGLPTDRCIAEWWLDSPRVKSVLAGRPPARTAPRSASRIPPISRASARDDRDGARARSSRPTRERFQDAFARGLAVTGFERTEEHGTYLLEPWQ